MPHTMTSYEKGCGIFHCVSGPSNVVNLTEGLILHAKANER